MVGFTHLDWLPEPAFRRLSGDRKKESNNLGILAFETARTMSRLLSLYKSISDEEIFKLKNDVIKSKGVAFLNSGDEGFLMNLAWAERLEDLDRAAAAVSRLGKKCSDLGLNRFDLIYRDMKHGVMNLGKLKYGSGSSERRIRKMEKLVETTSCLHEALEGLTEMEVSERRMKNCKLNEIQKSNAEIFTQKLANQRREVKYLREISLWGKSFDKCVDLMAKIVCVLYVRICSVFGPQRKISQSNEKIFPHSGPLLSQSKPVLVRFYSRKSPLFSDGNDAVQIAKSNSVFHAAGNSTVGGSGLAMRYANIILLAEKYLDSSISVSNDERESFYEMLPENLKSVVRAKLSKNMKYAENDACLAAGWRDAVAEMMEWLAPVADDTVKWQMERSFEKMKFEAKPTALLLQTLHFSDKEKTEAAIVEILVGLSCIFRFENRPLGV